MDLIRPPKPKGTDVHLPKEGPKKPVPPTRPTGAIKKAGGAISKLKAGISKLKGR